MASSFDQYRKEQRQKKTAKQRQRGVIEQSTPQQTPIAHGYLIERLSHEGRGIARDTHGKTVFVRGALPNEQVTAQITQTHSRFNEAQVVSVLQASSTRETPLCAHVETCGGCSLQHAAMTLQIQHKETVIREQLAHFADISETHLQRTKTNPLVADSYGYRRKARLGVTKTKSQGLVVGFRESQSKRLTSVTNCPILVRELSVLIPPLQTLLKRLKGAGNIGHIELIQGEERPLVVIRMLAPLHRHDIDFLSGFEETHKVIIVIAVEADRTDEKTLSYKTLRDEPCPDLTYTVFDGSRSLQMTFGPSDFLQVNANINQKMITQALQWLQLESHEHVLELFCGFGNFSLPLALHAASVTAIEVSTQQVLRGQNNASKNEINNLTFKAANLETSIATSELPAHPIDVVLLDPPRTGAQKVCEDISRIRPKRILYVSCNPATLARDAKILAKQGYIISKWGLIDMFPQTAHAECMALFTLTAAV